MKIKVTYNWDANHNLFYRLEKSDGAALELRRVGCPWKNAGAAKKALNLIEASWGVARSNVRFVHV